MESGKLISIKELQNQKKEEVSLQSYFKVLSFGQLINESIEITKELDDKHLDEDIALRSKAAISEISNRLEGQSIVFSKPLSNMKKIMEDRVSKFMLL